MLLIERLLVYIESIIDNFQDFFFLKINDLVKMN